MKKLLVALCALALVCAFAMPAGATDVKMSGEYYVQGYYSANSGLLDNAATSHAWFNQRLRMSTIFQVSKAVKFTTRYDIMESYWGGSDLYIDKDGVNRNLGTPGAANYRDDANISFDFGYLTFLTKCGKFDVGYMSDGVYGTEFGNAEVALPKIGWSMPIGKFYNVFQYKHWGERDVVSGNNESDEDYARYMDILFYFAKTWQAGFLYQYNIDATQSGVGVPQGYKTNFHVIIPYVKATMGNLYIESELSWIDGELRAWEDPNALGLQDIDMKGLAFYLKGKFNLGKGYIGGLFAYTKGNDISDATEVYVSSGGADWNPMLILWNKDYSDWNANNLGANTASGGTGNAMGNATLYQIFGGFNLRKNLDIFASISMAKADENSVAGQIDDDYGTEFDLKATYKMFDNLEYMVGFGYFWAGDWYKGANAAQEIDNEYILFHKLTLKF